MNLPCDGAILRSYLNTKLRDAYGSLIELCDDLEYSYEEVLARLQAEGYRYDEKKNQIC